MEYIIGISKIVAGFGSIIALILSTIGILGLVDRPDQIRMCIAVFVLALLTLVAVVY